MEYNFESTIGHRHIKIEAIDLDSFRLVFKKVQPEGRQESVTIPRETYTKILDDFCYGRQLISILGHSKIDTKDGFSAIYNASPRMESDAADCYIVSAYMGELFLSF